MRLPLVLACLLLSLALPAAPAAPQGREDVERYLLPNDFAVIRAGDASLGGVDLFPQQDESSVAVSVFDDLVGDRITIYACQDLNADSVCGDASQGEPGAVGCGQLSLAGIDPTQRVTVFIGGVHTTLGGCDADRAPTSGTVLAYFR